MKISRREFVRAGAAAAACGLAGRHARAADGGMATKLTLHAEKPGATMPANFTGLSYESAQLADPAFFSARNTGLVAEVKKLGPAGQLRLGGSLAESTAWWDPAVTPQRPTMTQPMMDAQKRFEWVLTTPSVASEKFAVITPESIRELRTFCDATGWSVMYGLNLGYGTPERAAAEGACVVRELGPTLDAFAVGNEADAFAGWRRPKTWTFDDYWNEFTAFERAVRERSAEAPFAGPDIAHTKWLQPFAEKAGKDPVMLCSHYYHMGYAGDPGINAQMLLTPKPNLQERLDAAQKATGVAGVAYRMTEVGSCARGGQPGASDAFASALWAAHVMLASAQAGVKGINMHGGGLSGFYSPIVGDQHVGYTSRPVTFGMRLANEFAGTTFVESMFDAPESAHVFAYAARKGSKLLVAWVNMGSGELRCEPGGVGKSKAQRAMVLSGPAIDSTTGTTLREVKAPAGVVVIPGYTAVLYEFKLA